MEDRLFLYQFSHDESINERYGGFWLAFVRVAHTSDNIEDVTPTPGHSWPGGRFSARLGRYT